MSSFNVDFAREKEDYLISCVREVRGCFNVNCREPSATKRCSKCQVVVYCSKACQTADWKRAHKGACKLYCQNTAPSEHVANYGQRGAAAIGLYSIGLIGDDILSKAILDRAVAFFKEAKKVIEVKSFGFGRPTIALELCVIYDMEKIRLVAAAKFHEKGSKFKTVTVNHVMFEVVSEETGEAARRRLHPPRGGSGDISEECREKVIEELYLFICSASQDHGIAIQGITYGRGLMWMKEDAFQKGEKVKMLEEANDPNGNKIIWMPDMGYLQEDAMTNIASAFGMSNFM